MKVTEVLMKYLYKLNHCLIRDTIKRKSIIFRILWSYHISKIQSMLLKRSHVKNNFGCGGIGEIESIIHINLLQILYKKSRDS